MTVVTFNHFKSLALKVKAAIAESKKEIQTWVGQQGYLTAIPDEYATEEYVNELVGSIDSILDTINGEVI